MIAHVLLATHEGGANRQLVVLGHQAEAVGPCLPPAALTVVQEPQHGTGHAVQVALRALPDLDRLPGDETDLALILYGDMPLITASTLRSLLDAHAGGGHVLTLLSALVPDPRGYGRVLRDAQGHATGVKEQKELAPHEESIAEINAGVYCVDMAWLRRSITVLPEHRDGEYYLPDLVPLALGEGGVNVVQAPALEEIQGVNTRAQLAVADRVMRARINEAHMLDGVTIVDPPTAYIERGVEIGPDTTIYPNTHLRGATRIGSNCVIGPDSEINASTVDSGAHVVRSVVEEARVGAGCRVGPFAHLRRGAVLAEGAEIGNYAEVKNATIGRGSVSHHFSYIGDTTMGAHVNVGAGTVTCNYDGARKYRTTIGDNVFVGSGTMLRAPVTLGDGSRTGAGAVVLRDVGAGVTVAGVPAREMDG